jgi:hypothetical protein
MGKVVESSSGLNRQLNRLTFEHLEEFGLDNIFLAIAVKISK